MVPKSAITDPVAAAAAGEAVTMSELATGKRIVGRDTAVADKLEKPGIDKTKAAIEAFNS